MRLFAITGYAWHRSWKPILRYHDTGPVDPLRCRYVRLVWFGRFVEIGVAGP